MPYPKRPLMERLHSRIDRSGGRDACWPWTGMTQRGYGLIVESHHGRRFLTHRLAYEAANGSKIPPDMSVCHRCDNPPCCNPAHLFLGTQSENAHDMWNKQRGYTKGPGALAAKGERVGGAKLTRDRVLEIRAARGRGESLKSIARRHGVCEATISLVASGRTWGHL